MTSSEYVIHRAAKTPALNGEPWDIAEIIEIACYPWCEPARKQNTTLRLLYDDEAIYLQFHCDDVHSFAEVTELNGPVCNDSCVEFFASPLAEKADYFNVEANCCGTLHLGFGPDRYSRIHISSEQARPIRIVSSIPENTKDESPDDTSWWLVAALPFRTLAEFIGQPARPVAGDIWRANAYRCGGKTDPPLATWAPINTEKPDYHRPEFFQPIRFA